MYIIYKCTAKTNVVGGRGNDMVTSKKSKLPGQKNDDREKKNTPKPHDVLRLHAPFQEEKHRH